ncbi:MAG: GNAT family N-acetyltransferase [Pseudomonadota bacterium]
MIVTDGSNAADRAEARAINNAAVPAVNALDSAAFDKLCALGELRIVRGDDVLGACLTLQPGADHASLNYQWFDERFDEFLYVDRIVVSPQARGRGVGRMLYEDVFERARLKGYSRVCSEVNVDPPNPSSLAFHASMGFRPLLERLNPAEGKTVSMMLLEFNSAQAAERRTG